VTALTWDTVGSRTYETGLDKGVLYIPDAGGAYSNGYAWSGLTKLTEKPTGATSNKQYADNQLYLNLISVEYFEADLSAFTYPEQWAQCDGSYEPEPGVSIGQQTRKSFGLCYRTRVGTDTDGTDAGYKLHLVYNAVAAPSQKAFTTINDNPAAMEFTWTITTIPVAVTGQKPTATITIDSTKVDAAALATLEGFLYGTAGQDPSLPMPDDVLALFAGTVTVVAPTVPTYDQPTHTITIPSVTGVTYYIDGKVVTGSVVITSTKVVEARPNKGYAFGPETADEWEVTY
jgi:hypothetical protein